MRFTPRFAYAAPPFPPSPAHCGNGGSVSQNIATASPIEAPTGASIVLSAQFNFIGSDTALDAYLNIRDREARLESRGRP